MELALSDPVGRTRDLHLIALTAAALGLGACHKTSPTLYQGPAALAVTGIANNHLTPGPYVIGPADVIDVRVAYEPELNVDSATVDTGGAISVPLIGTVRAAGKTAPQLAQEIEERLTQYVRRPEVSVNIREYSRQNVTVEGDVEEPGVYPVQGTSSLLQAVARAQGPTKTAKLNEVIVFRTVNGQRMGALFDLRRIRYGYDPDPLVLGGDTVVVGYSEVKGAFRDFLGAAPALAIFRPY
jgi:polysaccharide biosynthesis/export protein